jgi:hypothetical protein
MESEAELRTLARHLRRAIRQHVRMAKSSLGTKKLAIIDRDPDLNQDSGADNSSDAA